MRLAPRLLVPFCKGINMALYVAANLHPETGESLVQWSTATRKGTILIPYYSNSTEYYTALHAALGFYPDSIDLRNSVRYALYYAAQAALTWGAPVVTDFTNHHRVRLNYVFDHPTSGL